MRVPLDLDEPYWIDDEHFDLEYHVRHLALPSPGDWRQLCIQVARLVSRPLDAGIPACRLGRRPPTQLERRHQRLRVDLVEYDKKVAEMKGTLGTPVWS